MLPLIYTVLRRRHRAVNTLKHDALVFKWLYTWAWTTFGKDLDEILANERISEVLDRLEQLAFWLRTGRVTEKVIARIGRADGTKDWLHPKTFNGYLQTIELFLIWAAERYSKTVANREIRLSILEVKTRIESNFEALYLGGTSVTDVKGLEPDEISTVVLMLHPSANNNPFRKNARIRNWLIFRLFWESGPRRGELLKLKTTDLCEDGDKHYVVFRRLPDDPSDSRANPPAQKTLPRTVSISNALFLDLEKYIQGDRRPTRNGKRSVLGHQYLFTSERGLPLSISALNYGFAVM